MVTAPGVDEEAEDVAGGAARAVRAVVLAVFLVVPLGATAWAAMVGEMLAESMAAWPTMAQVQVTSSREN